MTTRPARRRRPSHARPERQFKPGCVPAPGEFLVWSGNRHFAWLDVPCVLCGRPTSLRSHAGEPAHKVCAEDWIAADPVEARRSGRFASDAQPKKPTSGHA
ncbi:hypothetical protein [Streptomyces sp. NPDC020489]|uniref:hypothetical protein n=1 Tax=Streptomyces sp. NPDC020489 TaxID=3365077 RepID=UPI003789A069